MVIIAAITTIFHHGTRAFISWTLPKDTSSNTVYWTPSGENFSDEVSPSMDASSSIVQEGLPVSIISKLNKDKMLDTVEGFELSEEKRSATNYLAKLKVKFNREDVDKLMNSLGAVFTEAPKKVKLEDDIKFKHRPQTGKIQREKAN